MFPKRSQVQDDLVDLARRERVCPGRHHGGKPHAHSPAADRIGEVRVALALLEGGFREIAGAGIEIVGVEAVSRPGLAVAGLTVVT